MVEGFVGANVGGLVNKRDLAKEVFGEGSV